MSESEERKNILFHIAHVEGLPNRPGWTPLAGTYVSVENLGTKESFDTEHKKITPGQTKWIENLPLLQVTESAQVRFAIKHQGFLNKRSVLGSTDTFTIQDLLSMQRAADHGIDKLVKLLVVLDPSAIRGPNSPKSPRLSRSSLNTVLTATSPSPRTSLDVPTPNRPMSPFLSPFPADSPRYATLYLAVRETAVDPGMNIRVNAASWRTFVEKCRSDSLVEFKSIVDKIALLRSTFEQDSNCICLIDIILGAIEATQKMLSDPENMNVNRHVTHAMMAINTALAPYQTFSPRQLAKRGENSVLFLQEMLFSIVSTMWVVGAVFAAKGDALVRDKLESRLIAWTDYFQGCTQFLTGQADQKPSLPAHKTSSTRVHCPKVLGPNSKIPRHNMIPMVLPEVHADDIYNRADVVRRLSEWVISSTFNDIPFAAQEVVSFAITPSLPSVPNTPRSPRELRRPSPLNLAGDDNFLPPHSILRPSEKRGKEKRASSLELPVDNVFCLSGPAKSGKTQLAARMCEWLLQLKCLGGYFTFDPSFDRQSPCLILDSLPMTLIHQVVTTERDSVGSFSKALTVKSDALDYPLEKRFETLFVEPLRDFVTGRANAKWNPLEPLVFIIDGIGVGSGSSTRGGKDTGEDEDGKMARMFVDWICSSGFEKLPRFVKFLVFMRSESEVARLLREKGVAVFEMGPALGSPMEVSNGWLGANGERCSVQASSRTFLANQL